MKQKEMEMERKEIVVKPINKKLLAITIRAMEGSTLIVHRLDPKTVDEFTSRETGKTKKKKLRDFDKEYKSCFHYTRDGKYGFPISGVMGAMLDAAVTLGIPKTHIKRSIRIRGDIVELKYDELNRRVDNPKRGGQSGAPDVRHRPEFINWSMDLMLQYDADIISPDQIINLINQGGFCSGIGDWRPSSPKSKSLGTHGMFEVEKPAK